MKGIIEQVWENESRNGQPYLTVQIDGERYSVWDTQYFDQLQEGAEIEYQFRQSGNFRNITEVAALTENNDVPMYQNGRDRQITRLSCLKSAAQILSPAQIDTFRKMLPVPCRLASPRDDMQGTVQKIWCNQRQDGTQYWVLSIDGTRYSTFTKEFVEDISEGDWVEFSFFNSGGYRKIAAIQRLSSRPTTTTSNSPLSAEALRIIRMNCLRTAAEILKGSKLLPEQRLSVVTTIAPQLQEYVLRPPGDDRPQQRKPKAAKAKAEGKHD